jgi:hypothetical protein
VCRGKQPPGWVFQPEAYGVCAMSVALRAWTPTACQCNRSDGIDGAACVWEHNEFCHVRVCCLVMSIPDLQKLSAVVFRRFGFD